jgi:hypothetical protein
MQPGRTGDRFEQFRDGLLGLPDFRLQVLDVYGNPFFAILPCNWMRKALNWRAMLSKRFRYSDLSWFAALPFCRSAKSGSLDVTEAARVLTQQWVLFRRDRDPRLVGKYRPVLMR